MSFSRKIRIFCVRTYQYWLPFLSFYSIRVYARAYRIQSSYAPTTVHVVLTYDDVYARINIDYHFYHFYSIRVYARAYRIQSSYAPVTVHVVLTSKSNNFSWISIFFIIFTQSVCTHVRTGFKAVTPLPQCMSYSIVRRKVLRMFKLPTKSLVEGYDIPSGESIFATKKRSPQTSSYANL